MRPRSSILLTLVLAAVLCAAGPGHSATAPKNVKPEKTPKGAVQKKKTKKTKAPEAPPVQTAGPARPCFYIDIGIGQPFQPAYFAADWIAGTQVGAGFGLPVAEPLSFVVDFHFNNFDINKRPGGAVAVTLGRNLQNFTLIGNGKLRLASSGSPAIPYLVGGGGISYLPNYSAQQMDAGNNLLSSVFRSESLDPLLRAGFGLDFRMDKDAALFLEVDGNWILNADSLVYGQLRMGLKTDL